MGYYIVGGSRAVNHYAVFPQRGTCISTRADCRLSAEHRTILTILKTGIGQGKTRISLQVFLGLVVRSDGQGRLQDCQGAR